MFNTVSVVAGASLTPSFWVKMDEVDSVGKAARQSMKDVCIHSQLRRTFITERAGPVNIFSLHGPIYPPWCPNGLLCRLSRTGTLGESPPILPIPFTTPDSRLWGGRGQAEREESCLPSTAQESSMAARLMTLSLKVTKELLCTRARLWGLIELSSS